MQIARPRCGRTTNYRHTVYTNRINYYNIHRMNKIDTVSNFSCDLEFVHTLLYATDLTKDSY